MVPSNPHSSETEVYSLFAHEVKDLLNLGELSINEVLDASIHRIETVDLMVNALPTRCFDRARAAIPAVQAGSLLAGIPVTVKDNIEVKGVGTSFGSSINRTFVSLVSDPSVSAVEASGGIVLAKSNLPEWSVGGMCTNPVFGATRNPWDVSRTCGGSSGGAAAALASGQAWFAIGGDLAGSLRTPAALCGVVGLRPTPGLIASMPTDIVLDLKSTNGPMARSVRDCALLLDAMVKNPDPSYEEKAVQAEGRLRIAYCPDMGGVGSVDDNIASVLNNALVRLNGEHEVVDYPERLAGLDHSYRVLRGVFFAKTFGAFPEPARKTFNDKIADNISFGRSVTPEDLGKAIEEREALRAQCAGLLDAFDVIACPVVGMSAPNIDLDYPVRKKGDDYLTWLSFSFLASLLELPSMSIPVGFDRDGMPVGIQLIGKPFGEAGLIRAASLLEQRFELNIRPSR